MILSSNIEYLATIDYNNQIIQLGHNTNEELKKRYINLITMLHQIRIHNNSLEYTIYSNLGNFLIGKFTYFLEGYISPCHISSGFPIRNFKLTLNNSELINLWGISGLIITKPQGELIKYKNKNNQSPFYIKIGECINGTVYLMIFNKMRLGFCTQYMNITKNNTARFWIQNKSSDYRNDHIFCITDKGIINPVFIRMRMRLTISIKYLFVDPKFRT